MNIKVWDLPVRVSHWLLVAVIVFQFLSTKVLDDTILANTMQWHFYSGYTCLAIVIFRICWGVLGTYYAKFSQFLLSPIKTIQYLRGVGRQEYIGHNPLGAYSVIALLSVVLTQAISGLFTTDDIFNDGPYFGVLDNNWQQVANFIHHKLYYLLVAFIVFHIGAIIFYKLKRKQSLTKAMITGRKKVNKTTQSVGPFPWVGFIISLAITAVVMYLIIDVLPPEPVEVYFGY